MSTIVKDFMESETYKLLLAKQKDKLEKIKELENEQKEEAEKKQKEVM
jgi:hypothetical protein